MQEAIIRVQSAESTRTAGLEAIQQNARGSVATDAQFRVMMARASAQHNETLAQLKAIEGNTGKFVTSMSAGYKEMSESFFKRTNLATFGLGGGYETTRSGPQQQPVTWADRETIHHLQTLSKLAGQALRALQRGSVARYS